MTWPALLCALGAALFFSGLPMLRRPGISDRVMPYLRGLGEDSIRTLEPAKSLVESLVGSRFLSKLPGSTDSELADRLKAAGDDHSPTGFRVGQLVWATIAAMAALVLAGLAAAAGARGEGRVVPVFVAVAFVTGWLTRDWWLGRQITERRAALKEELPTAIDLVTLSIMAGESVPAAFARVAGILRTGVGHEFALVVADMRAGSNVVDALEAMKSRWPEAIVARLVDALITGIERGAPLAAVLRAQADDCREARRRELLEMGGRREVLMLVPVVFLIMPVVVAYALFPGLVSLDLLVP